MTLATPEFSRPLRVDTLGSTPRAISIGAKEEERAALATRFGLLGIERLTAEAAVTRRGDEIRAVGSLSAAVTQSCVATDLPVPEMIEEQFEIVFRPPPQTSAEEEIELSEGELDVVFYQGAEIDVGEAVAETMTLSLDPYPRSPEADTVLKQAGVKSEEEAAPLSPLAGLKDLLAGKKT
jgi:uncharacterized metal-binding protein YceD (DUF177 family)